MCEKAKEEHLTEVSLQPGYLTVVYEALALCQVRCRHWELVKRVPALEMCLDLVEEASIVNW